MAAADAPGNLHVMCMGHSFVRSLRDWAFTHQNMNLNLDRSSISVLWHGIGGGIICRLSISAPIGNRDIQPKVLWNVMAFIGLCFGQLCVLGQS